MTPSFITRIKNIRNGTIHADAIEFDDPQATSPRKFVWQAMVATRRFSLPAAGAAVIHQIGETLVPVIMGRAIDSAVATGDLGSLIFWIVLLALNFGIFSITARMGYWYGQLGAEAMQHQLRTRLTEKLLHPRARGERLPGTALSLATNDVRRLGMAIALLVYPVGDLAAIIFGGTLLLLVSPPLGLAVLLGAPLLLVILDFAGRPLRTRAEKEAEAVADAAGSAADLISGYRVLKGIGAEEQATDRYRTFSGAALRSTMAARRTRSHLTFGMRVGTGLFVAAIAVAAALIAIGGDMTVGEFITVVALTQFLITPLTAFATNTAPIWSAALASARRILDLMNETSDDQGEHAEVPGTNAEATLTFTGLRVGDHDPLDLHIEHGSLVGIGADGAIAAALADVIAARREPVVGSVLTSGVPIDMSEPLAARDRVLVAPHEASMFDGTVAENLQVPGHNPDLLQPALHAASCDDVLDALPHGIESTIGEGGLRLSGGQRQRLALARALATGAPVLVLHEPTTAVDSVTEANIAQRLPELRRGLTTVLITTSPALLARCDEVVMPRMNGGES